MMARSFFKIELILPEGYQLQTSMLLLVDLNLLKEKIDLQKAE